MQDARSIFFFCFFFSHGFYKRNKLKILAFNVYLKIALEIERFHVTLLYLCSTEVEQHGGSMLTMYM